MEEERYQKELFEFDQPKKSFSRLSDILPRADFEGRIMLTLSLEKLIFITIGVIMVMVVLYALGVESGKLSARHAGSRPAKQAVPPVMPPVLQVRPATIPARSILSTAPLAPAAKTDAILKANASNASKVRPSLAPAARPYTILAGSFSKVENARAAGAMLVRQGFTVTISYNAPYYMVSAGAYADRNHPDTHKDLARIRRIFKDATIKIR